MRYNTLKPDVLHQCPVIISRKYDVVMQMKENGFRQTLRTSGRLLNLVFVEQVERPACGLRTCKCQLAPTGA